MTVNFEYVGTDVSESLSKFAEEKLSKLFERNEFVTKATVRFKHDDNLHEHGKMCDIELSVPGKHLFATAKENNYEVAVRTTISELERQLEKRKHVFKTH